MRSRRTSIAAGSFAAALIVGACGGGSDSATPQSTLPALLSESGDTTPGDVFTESDGVSGEAPAAAEPAATPTAPAEPDPSTTTAPTVGPTTTPPTVQTAPAATVVPPSDVEISAELETEAASVDEPSPATRGDATPTPARVGGRELGESLRAEASFAANPFPDLLVDDVGRAAKVNIANLLPSDRPVLIWAWAPH